MEAETTTLELELEFPNGGKAIVEQIASKERNPKEQNCKNHSLGSE